MAIAGDRLRLDEAAVDRVTETFGLSFALMTARSLGTMGSDDAISPAEFSRGLILAHIKGAAAAIASASMNQVGDQEQLVDVAIAQLRLALLPGARI